MTIKLFYELSPEIAERETRRVTIFEDCIGYPPKGHYAFVDAYCTDPECDCRMALIHIIELGSGRCEATITHAFDSDSWWASEESKTLLEPDSESAEHSEFFLQKVKENMTQEYESRLERHYKAVKDLFSDFRIKEGE